MAWYNTVWDFVTGAADTASKHQGLIKTGIAALSTYGAFKDQQKKNEMQQAAYDDYMRQAEAAGFEAQAAVDLNLTPMTVSGVPTTKADVTDFTAVAAKGGLMSIPNRQRKRYATGPEEIEVMEMDEEVITPLDLQQETGIDLTGEQVKYNTGNSRQDAWGVWNSGGIDQEIYEFDFEIFFNSGDWMDMLRGQAPATENMQMASDPGMGEGPFMMEEFLKAVREGFTGSYEDYIDQIDRSPADYWGAKGGIAGLRHGGRPGYNIGEIVTADTEAVTSEVPQSQKNLIEGNQMAEDALNKIMYKFMEKFPGIDSSKMGIEDMIAMLQAEGVWETEGAGIMDIGAGMDMITPESVKRATQRFARGDTQWGDIPMAKGGRIRKANGGIMDLGGMEKDYRFSGGFVPIGAYEKKDDVPARLSKNEFVFTADAVRAAGGGSINKGAQRMYDTMKNLEARPEAKRMTA
jgi:hypothetical protein